MPATSTRARAIVSRRMSTGMAPGRLLEGEAAHATVDRRHRAGDVAGPRRGEEDCEVGELLRLAEPAHRDVFLSELPAVLLGGVETHDLLAHDAAGLYRVDGDAILGELP